MFFNEVARKAGGAAEAAQEARNEVAGLQEATAQTFLLLAGRGQHVQSTPKLAAAPRERGAGPYDLLDEAGDRQDVQLHREGI